MISSSSEEPVLSMLSAMLRFSWNVMELFRVSDVIFLVLSGTGECAFLPCHCSVLLVLLSGGLFVLSFFLDD